MHGVSLLKQMGHKSTESYAVDDGRIIADFGDLFRVSLDEISKRDSCFGFINGSGRMHINCTHGTVYSSFNNERTESELLD